MGLSANDKGGGDFKSVSLGTHVARSIRLIDLGMQRGEYQGKANVKHQALLTWELPNELMDDGRPFVISKFYTLSLGEKANLRHDLEAWRGRAFTEEEKKGFDLRQILDKGCMLSVIDKNGKTKVGGVMALPKGTIVPVAANEIYYFDLDEFVAGSTHAMEIYNKLSDGIRRIINERVLEEVPAPEDEPVAGVDGLDSDVPF